jgi:hypothetical protein
VTALLAVPILILFPSCSGQQDQDDGDILEDDDNAAANNVGQDDANESNNSGDDNEADNNDSGNNSGADVNNDTGDDTAQLDNDAQISNDAPVNNAPPANNAPAGNTGNTGPNAALPMDPPAAVPDQSAALAAAPASAPAPAPAAPSEGAPLAGGRVRYAKTSGIKVTSAAGSGTEVRTLDQGDHPVTWEENGFLKLANGMYVPVDAMSDQGVPRTNVSLGN